MGGTCLHVIGCWLDNDIVTGAQSGLNVSTSENGQTLSKQLTHSHIITCVMNLKRTMICE